MPVAGKVNAGLAESNGCLPPGLMTQSPAKRAVSDPCRTLDREYGITFVSRSRWNYSDAVTVSIGLA